MNVKDILAKWNGKYVDWDKFYGYQCVDWYRQYCHELGLSQSPGVAGAKDIWNSYNKSDFTKINNAATNYPQRGDIVIWKEYPGNPYGHVGVADTATANDFVSYDQNWPVGSPVHPQPHNYDYVLGWLRPKALESTTQPDSPIFTTTVKQLVTDNLLALKGNTSDDEINAWVVKFENPHAMVNDVLRNDNSARTRWLEIWGLPEQVEVIKEVPVEVVKEVVKEIPVPPSSIKGRTAQALYRLAIRFSEAGK